jgi:hypothetical protein
MQSMVLASYLILQTINPDLVNFDLNLELPPPETITCHPHQAQPTEPGVYLIEWFHNDGRCPVTQYSRYTKFATMDACGAAERESTAPSHMCTEMKGGAACFIVDVYSPGRFWGWYYESTERKCQIADKVGNSGAAMGACNTEMILYASKRRDTDTTRYVVKTGCHFQ